MIEKEKAYVRKSYFKGIYLKIILYYIQQQKFEDEKKNAIKNSIKAQNVVQINQSSFYAK